LGTLADDVVFLGGAVAGLLITDHAAQPLRPTDDVDLLVRIGSLVEYHQLGEQLRRLGFQEDMRGGVMCRWIIDDITVDIMPYDGLGLRNQWFRPALECPTVIEFNTGQRLRIVSAPYFCATKLDAYGDRGNADLRGSHDIEDVIAIVDGRESLFGEVERAGDEVRAYLAQTIKAMLDDKDFEEAVVGHLGGMAGQRFSVVLERLGRIAALTGRP